MHDINNYINNGIKELIRQYQNCKIGHLFLLGGFVYVRQFCVLELLLKPMPFLYHFDVGVFFSPRYGGFCAAYILVCVCVCVF